MAAAARFVTSATTSSGTARSGRVGLFSPLETLWSAAMRDTLDHLPQAKQRELAQVVRVLFEEFEAAHVSTTTK